MGKKVPTTTGFGRILLIDIETFPNEYRAWRLWDGRALKVLKFSEIVCVSAKFLGEKERITFSISDHKWNAKAFTRKLHKLVSSADILVAHNGKGFDFGRMNSQFIRHGFPPPEPTQKIDTKKAAKRVFGFDSNSLDLLCQYLGIGEKLNTGGYDLWEECMMDDPKAWKRMKKYNEHDVKLLEALYLKLRPWMPDHPNMGLYTGGACPKCGADENMVMPRGTYESKTRLYDRYRCKACTGWLKSVKSKGRGRFTNTDQ